MYCISLFTYMKTVTSTHRDLMVITSTVVEDQERESTILSM